MAISDSSMMTFASIIDPLRAANRMSRLPLYSWEIISVSGEPIQLTCGVEIKADSALDDKLSGDLLVVIAGFDHDRQLTAKNRITLHDSARKHKVIFGVEAGTWLLAKAGIITHHKVTTHWEDLENLAENYRRLDVSSERYVIDHNIWTCGGASPALDMMLHYIRDTQNKSLALDVASVFIYSESSPQTEMQSSLSLGPIEKIEPRLAKAIKLMENNIEEPLQTSELAEQVGISSKTLENLWRKHLGTTPGSYYLRLRLQSARRLVIDSKLSILEVGVRCGFNSQSALARAFSKRYGQSPLSLRQSAKLAG